LPWGTIGAAFVPRIPKTMKTTPGNQQPLTNRHYISNDFLGIGITNQGTHRHFYHQIVARFAGTLAAHTLLTALGRIASLKTEVRQGVQPCIRFQVDTATIATITAVWPTLGNILFPAKTHAAVTTITGSDLDSGFIYKFHQLSHSTLIFIFRIKKTDIQKSPDKRGFFINLVFAAILRRHHADE
jgi:hypothetical protein